MKISKITISLNAKNVSHKNNSKSEEILEYSITFQF